MNLKTAKKLRRLARIKAAGLPPPRISAAGVPDSVIVRPHMNWTTSVEYHPEKSYRGIYLASKERA